MILLVVRNYNVLQYFLIKRICQYFVCPLKNYSINVTLKPSTNVDNNKNITRSSKISTFVWTTNVNNNHQKYYKIFKQNKLLTRDYKWDIILDILSKQCSRKWTKKIVTYADCQPKPNRKASLLHKVAPMFWNFNQLQIPYCNIPHCDSQPIVAFWLNSFTKCTARPTYHVPLASAKLWMSHGKHANESLLRYSLLLTFLVVCLIGN